MTSKNSYKNQRKEESDLKADAADESIPLTHWQLRRPAIPEVMHAVRQPLIDAATYAEASLQMLKYKTSSETIAHAVESTLAEIMRAGQGLYELSENLCAKGSANPDSQQATEETYEGVFMRALDTLTPRENQVFSAAVDGLDSAKIAEKLKISQRTVESHRASIIRKFEVNSLADLYRTAAAFGISLPPPRIRR